jgi:REP element-mobilizing transposase RayT
MMGVKNVRNLKCSKNEETKKNAHCIDVVQEIEQPIVGKVVKNTRVQEGSIHVYFRGNGRFNVFYGDLDKIEFLKRCNKAAELHSTAIEQIVLMDNHVHLHVNTKSLTPFAYNLIHGYSYWYNKKHGLSGKMFESPFNSSIRISDVWIMNSMLYILQNPLSAGICNHPKEYTWSSYHSYFTRSNAKPNPINKYLNIDKTFIYDRFKSLQDFDKAILEESANIKEIREVDAKKWEKIPDAEVIRLANIRLNGRNVFHFSKSEIESFILELRNEIGASYRQISSITHQSWEYVRRVCK